MLKALELENFKAFGERTRIEFAPITLVFGENSAGKSSILQALNLLKQTRDSRMRGAALLPRTERGIVDLGSFKELIFNHDLKRELSFRLDTELPRHSSKQSRSGRHSHGTSNEMLGLEISFGRSSKSGVIALRSMTLYSSRADGRIATFSPVWISKKKMQSIMRDSVTMLRMSQIGRVTASPSGVLAAECSWLTEDTSLWTPFYHKAKQRAADIVGALKKSWRSDERMKELLAATRAKLERELQDVRRQLSQLEEGARTRSDLLARYVREVQLLAEESISEEEKQERLDQLRYEFVPAYELALRLSSREDDTKDRIELIDQIDADYSLVITPQIPDLISDEAIKFYESDFTLDAFVRRMRDAQAGSIILLDGFTPFPMASTLPEKLPEFSHFIQARADMHRSSVDVVEIAVKAGEAVDAALDSLYPMGPFRRPPERWYIFTGTSPQDVGYRGDLLPDLLFCRPELVDDTNEWLDRLEVGYHIKVQSDDARSRDLFAVRLIDKRRGNEVDVALSDVGYGVSQLLPFVVQCLAGESQIITIEQPEVHIHPRLQADLGDLLAAAIHRPRNHRFIIETHSEHLVLRMQRLIREQKLRPDDVSIIYVSRSDKGSSAKRLHLDEDGDFIDEWPGGFFPERLKELR